MLELEKSLLGLRDKGNFRKEEIEKITNSEALMFIITEKKMSKNPQYNNIGGLFDSLRETIFEKGGMNIFEEHLTIKLVYFREVYDVPEIILESLVLLKGPVLLDYELEKNFIEEDDFYRFFMKRYQDFKQNNELTILKMLNAWSNMDNLSLDMEKLQGVLGEFKKYIPEEQQ